MDKILEEKLRNFSALVMADARKKSDKLTTEAEEKSKEILNENEDKFLTDAYSEIQKSVLKYSKSDNERVLHTEVDAKKQILKKREEIINRVFSNAAQKIKEFMNTPEYEQWLLNITKKAFAELGEGSKTVFVIADDLKFSDKIKELSADKTEVLEANSDGFIGGIRAFNNERHLSVDYSFNELLEAQKDEFLQKAGLSIN